MGKLPHTRRYPTEEFVDVLVQKKRVCLKCYLGIESAVNLTPIAVHVTMSDECEGHGLPRTGLQPASSAPRP